MHRSRLTTTIPQLSFFWVRIEPKCVPELLELSTPQIKLELFLFRLGRRTVDSRFEFAPSRIVRELCVSSAAAAAGKGNTARCADCVERKASPYGTALTVRFPDTV